MPPFADAIARRTVEADLGPSGASQLEYVRSDPVASASLGQVYRCRDRASGREVAVKVQRPGALFAVSLDVAIGASKLSNFLNASTQLLRVLARASGHTHLSQFDRNDITRWKKEMADLTGLDFAGSGGSVGVRGLPDRSRW